MDSKYGKKFKQMNDVLKIEDIKVDVKYTFNFNPNDDFQYWHATDRIDKLHKMAQYWLDDIDAIIEMQMEVSPLGRLHFHGTIKWGLVANAPLSAPASQSGPSALLSFYLFTLPKLVTKGTLKIGNITDEAIWDTYCHKQKALSLPSLKTTDSHTKRLNKLSKPFTIKYKPIDEF